MPLLAQRLDINGFTIEGPLKIAGTGADGAVTIADIVNRVMLFVLPLASVILFASIVWGGYDIVMSQGSAEKLKAGRGKIITGLVGFAILGLAFLITQFISTIFNIGQGIV